MILLRRRTHIPSYTVLDSCIPLATILASLVIAMWYLQMRLGLETNPQRDIY